MKVNLNDQANVAKFAEYAKASNFKLKHAEAWAEKNKIEDAKRFVAVLRRYAVKVAGGEYHMDYDGDGKYRVAEKVAEVAAVNEEQARVKEVLNAEREANKQVRAELKAAREAARAEREAKREARQKEQEARQKARLEKAQAKLKQLEDRRKAAEGKLEALKTARAEREAKRKTAKV